MTEITWTQISETSWKTNKSETGLYAVVDMLKDDGGTLEYWPQTRIDNDIPYGPGETGDVHLDLASAMKAAEDYLAEPFEPGPAI